MVKFETSDALRPLAAPALIGASLVNFLVYQNYSILRGEIALLAMAVLAGSALLWLVYSNLPRIGRALIEAGLITLFLDINTKWLPSFVLVLLGLTALLFLLRLSVMRLLAVFGLVVLLTSLVGLGGSRPVIAQEQRAQPRLRGDLPPVIHIILDEQIGIEGLKREGGDSARLAEAMKAAYLQRGFAVYGKAYSQHFHTFNAIPQELGLGQPYIYRPVTGLHWRVGPTPWLDRLARRGYAIRAYQSDYVDFCSLATVASCTTYSASTLAASLDYPIPVAQRAQLVLWKFAALSATTMRVLNGADRIYGRVMPAGSEGPAKLFEPQDLTTGLASMLALDRLAADLRRARPGEMYFAHLLLPHYPYLFGADCTVLPVSQWRRRGSAVPMAERRRRYNDQARCTLARVTGAIDGLAAAMPDRRFAAIIQGDHGSRLTQVEPLAANRARLTEADIVAGFSTFFAVHPIGGTPGYADGARPISSLLRDFLEGDFRRAPPNGNRKGVARVRLRDALGRPQSEAMMPATW